MRELGWTLIQYDWCKKKLGAKYVQRENHVKTQEKADRLKVTERDLIKINAADNFISDFKPPEL